MGGRRTRTRHPTTTPDPEDDPPPFRPVAQERIYVAVVTGDQHLTLTEVDQTANRIAHVLAGLGMDRAAQVGLLVYNGLWSIPVDFACLKAAAVRCRSTHGCRWSSTHRYWPRSAPASWCSARTSRHTRATSRSSSTGCSLAVDALAGARRFTDGAGRHGAAAPKFVTVSSH